MSTSVSEPSETSVAIDTSVLAREISNILFVDESQIGQILIEIKWETVLGLAADAVDAAGKLDAFPGFGLICKGLSSLIRYQASNIGKTEQPTEIDKLIRALDSQVNRIVTGIDRTTTEITRRSFLELQKDTSGVWVTLATLLRRPNEPYLDDFLNERSKHKPDVTLENVRTFVVDHSLLDNVIESSLRSHRIFDAWSTMIQNVCSQLVLCQLMYLEIGEVKDILTRAEKESQVKDMLDKVKIIYETVDRQKKSVLETYLTSDKSVRQLAEDICKKYEHDSNEHAVVGLKALMKDEYYWMDHAVFCSAPYYIDNGTAFIDTRRRAATHFKNKVLHFEAHGCEIHIAQVTDSKLSSELFARYIRDQYQKGDENFIDQLDAAKKALRGGQLRRAGVCQSLCDQLRNHIKSIMDVNAVIVVAHTYFNNFIGGWDELYKVRNSRQPLWAEGYIPNAAVGPTTEDFKHHSVHYFNNFYAGHFLTPDVFSSYCLQVIFVF